MVSTLAAQLQQLREGGAGSKQKTASFLYDAREAARVDNETVYNLAWNGLLELQQLDARLDELVTADDAVARLFSRQRINFHRASATKQEDAELDAALARVLDALSGFFLLGATHKVLEFLVRRYEIHRCNVDAVMAAIVSYHESKWFARMVRLLHIHNTRWEFLLQVKQTGEPLLRAALVQRAKDEPSVITFIFDSAARIGAANPKLVSLYTMVVLELLERETPMREDTLRWLIPQLLVALKAASVPELQSSAYMVITKLASKASLTDKVVATLVKYLLKYAQPGGAQMNALLCVMFVAQSQTSFAFSKGTVKHLIHVENVADLITDAATSYDATRFVQLLTAFLAQHMTSSTDEYCTLLMSIIAVVPAVKDSVEDLVATLIAYAQEEQFAVENDRVAAVREILATLGKQYMMSVDVAVNAALQNKDSKKKDKMLSKFLTKTFGNVTNSAHFVPSNTDAATSLALSLDHPTEHIRYQALVSLEKQYQQQSATKILANGNVLLRRLLDDSERIVKFMATSALGELLVSLCSRKKVLEGIVQAMQKWSVKASSVTVVEAIVGFALDHFRKSSTEFDDRLVTLFLSTTTRGGDRQSAVVEWKRVVSWIVGVKDHAFSVAAAQVLKQDEKVDEESVARAFGQTLADNVRELLPICLRWSKPSDVNKVPLTAFLIQVLRVARLASGRDDKSVLVQALRDLLKEEFRSLCGASDKSSTTSYAVTIAQALCEVADPSTFAVSRSEFDSCVAALLQSPAHLFILVQAELLGIFRGDLEAELLPTMARLVAMATTPGDVMSMLSKTRALDIICAALEGFSYVDDVERQQAVHIVPVMLVALADRQQPVRSAAVASLDRWLSSSSDVLDKKTGPLPLKQLFALHQASAFLLQAKEDMTMDANAVHVRCGAYGTEHESESGAFYQLLMDFISTASADEMNVAVKLLDLLASVKQPSFWHQSLDFFQQTVTGYTGEIATSTKLLTTLLGHYLDADVAVSSGKKSNKVSKEFFNALMSILNVDEGQPRRLQKLQLFALSKLSRKYFECLDEVSQYALVVRCLRLLMVADETVAAKMISCLNVLPINTAIFVSMIKEAATDIPRLNCILEVLSIKVDGDSATAMLSQQGNTLSLLNALGDVLALFCDLKHEKVVSEYMFQVLFMCLRRVCDEGSTAVNVEGDALVQSKSASKLLKQASGKVDPESLVKHTLACLARGTTSPPTRNEALLFVSALVNLYPTSVLQSLESILSFVGAGAIRHDDEYTFHVVETIIKSVVPHLVKSEEGSGSQRSISTQHFLGIFVSAFGQIPAAKRPVLFEVLVKTLGVEKHLAYCVALLLQRSAMHPEESEATEQFAHSLCLSFDCVQQISTSVKVLRLARDMLPYVVDESDTDTDDVDDDDDEADLPSDPTYEPLSVDDKVMKSKPVARRLNSALLSFVEAHLRAPELHRMILAFQQADAMDVDDDEAEGDASGEQLQHNYLMLAQVVLLFFRRAAREQSLHDDAFWGSLTTASMDILGALQQLLSTPSFIAVISELLHHDNGLVRKKAMQLFNERLQNDRGSLTSGEELLFVDMLDELDTILQNADNSENSINIQTALLSVDILARNFAAAHTKRFQKVLPTLVKFVNVDVVRVSATALHILGCAFVALSSVCRAVGPVVFPLLPTFFPKLLAALEHCSGSRKQRDGDESASTGGVKTVVQCLLTALEVFTEKIPQFLAPYLSKTIQTLLSPSLLSTSPSNAPVLLSVDCCMLNLANNLELRQLLPSLFAAYDHALSLGDVSVEKLFSVVATVVSSLDATSLRQFLPNFARFFVTALDIRRVHSAKLVDLEQVEDEILECLVQFILKLSEKQLKPLFLKVSEWAAQPQSASDKRRPALARRIVFNKLLIKLSDRLRSIFVPYYVHVLEFLVTGLVESREVLARKPTRRGATEDADSSDDEDDFFTRDEDEQPPAKKSKLATGVSDAEKEKEVREVNAVLLRSTVQALDGCFVHDSDGFMEKERFDVVLAPLVDVFDVLKHDDLLREFVFENVATTLANLAWAAKNDLLWKPLHYAVLMKSRGDCPAIRLAALKTVEKCYQVIGDEFLAMLPESIPFLAELMEDTDADVERTCHEVIKQIEDISGESLDQYLTT